VYEVKTRQLLVTGSNGLIGSEMVTHFHDLGWVVHGLDNNMRADKAREGDHICYISDLTKMKHHYPNWTITKSLDDIFEELVVAWTDRVCTTGT